jgi:hypothetical protein
MSAPEIAGLVSAEIHEDSWVVVRATGRSAVASTGSPA